MADDVEIVTLQLGRAPVPFTAVVSRCPAGRPVAIAQPPWTPAGVPFPTSYWLTCPGLVAAIGRLEADGGIAALQRLLALDEEMAAAFDEGRRRQIALRPDFGDLGIGGTRAPRAVKCLHAHAAFALGHPPYPVGDRIIADAGGLPAAGCCMGTAA